MAAIAAFQKLLHASLNSEEIAIFSENENLSYREFIKRSLALAQFFGHQGLKKGDKIAVQLPNCIEFILCYFAGIFGGYTLVPINQALPEQDIAYILNLTQPKMLIKNQHELDFKSSDQGFFFNSDEESIVAIFFTSGTTNRPKGVCHSLENMLANAQSFNALTQVDQSIRMLHVMPMGYMAGFLNTLLCPLVAGGSVVLALQFNAANAIHFWEPARIHGANALWITPTMAALLARLNRDAELTKWTCAHLQRVFVGTAPLPQAIKANFEQTFGVECLESYGMTEVMLVSGNTPCCPRKLASVGRLLDGVQIRVCGEDGQVLSLGAAGNVFVNSPFALRGYLESGTNSLVSPLRQGWLSTGDYGYIDSDRNLFITGRTKDLIIHGGTNVSPRAIEETLLHHPDIEDVAVIGQPHAFWGEEVVAFLIMKPNKNFDKANIVNYCKQNLVVDAIPAVFKILDEFPRASTGKVQKNKLKEYL